MSYYHYLSAEIDVWNAAKKEDLYPLFRDLLDFYGKTTFDEESAVDDITIVLTNRPALPGAPAHSKHRDLFVRVEAQGDVSSSIEDAVKSTCRRLSRYKRLWFSRGVFILTNADTIQKARIPYGPTRSDRQYVVLRSCLDEFMTNVEGVLPATRHKALHAAMADVCAKATASSRPR